MPLSARGTASRVQVAHPYPRAALRAPADSFCPARPHRNLAAAGALSLDQIGHADAPLRPDGSHFRPRPRGRRRPLSAVLVGGERGSERPRCGSRLPRSRKDPSRGAGDPLPPPPPPPPPPGGQGDGRASRRRSPLLFSPSLLASDRPHAPAQNPPAIPSSVPRASRPSNGLLSSRRPRSTDRPPVHAIARRRGDRSIQMTTSDVPPPGSVTHCATAAWLVSWPASKPPCLRGHFTRPARSPPPIIEHSSTPCSSSVIAFTRIHVRCVQTARPPRGGCSRDRRRAARGSDREIVLEPYGPGPTPPTASARLPPRHQARGAFEVRRYARASSARKRR